MIVLAEDRVPLELDCISYRIIQEDAQLDLFKIELLYERKEFKCNIVHTFTIKYNPNLSHMISYMVGMLFNKLSNELNNKDLVLDMQSKDIKQLQTNISYSLWISLEDKFPFRHTI